MTDIAAMISTRELREVDAEPVRSPLVDRQRLQAAMRRVGAGDMSMAALEDLGSKLTVFAAVNGGRLADLLASVRRTLATAP